MKKTTSPRKYIAHLIGIGGIGMSALAQWFLGENWAVSGSDIAESIITRKLRKLGVQVKIGHKAANLPRRAEMVVRSQAITPKNPEFALALRRKWKVLTYPEAVGRLTWWGYKTIAVAGAHGKSTTAALAGLTLMRGGLDPTIIVGTLLTELGGTNYHAGKTDWLVLEADEYGKAFLHYAPLMTIITNVDAEHLDTYGDLAGVKKGFLEFMTRTRRGGAFIVNKDDKNLRAMHADIERIAKERACTLRWYSLRDPKAIMVRGLLRLHGEHNVSNALAVLYLAELLKL